MDYEKKYKNALEAIKKLQEANPSDEGIQNWVNDNFPELKESEDERIRKEIIEYIKTGTYHKDWIAWLEKQKSVDENKIIKRIKTDIATSLINYINANSKGMCLSNMECEDIEDAIVNNKWYKVYNYMKKELEKQGEKPQDESESERIRKAIKVIKEEEKVDNANKVESKDYSSIDPHFFKTTDKVEPKFKVGDWVVWDNKILCHIDNIYPGKESLMYTITDTNSMIRSYSVKRFDNNAHFWTIQNAKNGEVLAEDSCIFILKEMVDDFHAAKTYCTLFNDGEFYDGETLYFDVDSTRPATKEQRELLFQEMKKNGYTFDFKKKKLNELKKIEQNSAWSEEDDYNVQCLAAKVTSDIQNGNVGRNQELIDWLKSLKQRIEV